MHIKNIHSMIEKLAECAKVELDKGIENVDTKELKEVSEILSELCEAEVQAKISKAMDEAEAEENLDMYEKNNMRYYNNRRYENGRFAPKGRGRRYFMPEYDMDFDYMDYGMGGRMYYGGNGQSGNNSNGSQMNSNMGSGSNRYYSDNGSMQSARDSREGRSGMARMRYYDSKELHRSNTPEDKQAKMKELENYTKELAEDVTAMVADMSQEEKNLLKTKMQTLMAKIV